MYPGAAETHTSGGLERISSPYLALFSNLEYIAAMRSTNWALRTDMAALPGFRGMARTVMSY
jgi:hypothetical protein